MKKLTILSLFSIILFSCSSNNNSTSVPSIDNSVFFRTKYILETPVDANGDGVFSIDLYDELNCGADGLQFEPGAKVANPTFHGISLNVSTDTNGNQIQSHGCGIGDGLLPTYQQVDDEVFLLYGEDIELVGSISANGNEITFTIPREKLYSFGLAGGNILNPDGTITNYQGTAVVTYTRQ